MIKQSLIHYRVRWKPSGYFPGATRGLAAGIGDQLRSVVLLRDNPDPRRLDLRTSMRDPFQHLWVRDFNLNAALKVIVLIDTSASMGYCGSVNRMQVVQDIASKLALSAYRNGDAFGLYAADEALNKTCSLPARANRGAWLWVQHHLSKIKPRGRHADGLLEAVAGLPQRPCLVFVISDFRWSEGKLKQMMKKMSHHDVVPIILQDPAEMSVLPNRGIAMLRDMETGASKFVWMRPSLQRKMMAVRQHHIESVRATCRIYGKQPFVVNGAFNPDHLTRYFMERARQ